MEKDAAGSDTTITMIMMIALENSNIQTRDIIVILITMIMNDDDITRNGSSDSTTSSSNNSSNIDNIK